MTAAERVELALKQVVDPEVGVNVVDLGLVYSVAVEAGDVRVRMTMTSAACPMTQLLQEQAAALIRTFLPDAASIEVEIVWDPPWNPSMMTEEGRRILGV